MCLIAITSGSSTAASISRSTDVENLSYGWLTRMSPSRIAAKMSDGLVALAAQARARHALPLGVEQLGALEPGQLDQVGAVEQAVAPATT